MKKLKFNGKIDSKGHLKIDVPTTLQEGDVEIVMIIEQKNKSKNKYNFSDISGKLKWNGDALKEQQALRN